MPILTVFAAGGTTLRNYPTGHVTGLTATAGVHQILLRWTDPADEYWAGTKILRKTGGYPADETDGTVVVDSRVRNQYQLVNLVDAGLQYGTTYYYRAFAYSVKGIYTYEPVSTVSATPKNGELQYYGTITPLSVSTSYAAATNVGDYALFGGGVGSTSDIKYANVDSYNYELTKSTATSLSVARYHLAATNIGNYALFGGGYSGTTQHDTIDSYDINLTKGTATALSVPRHSLAATTVGNYALFGGGGHFPYSAIVDSYNTSLTKGTATVLNKACYMVQATSVGNFALFGGGQPVTAIVDSYDVSLTKGTAAPLSVARHTSVSTVGEYAIFGGGWTGSGLTDVVDSYNTSLANGTPSVLSVARVNITAVAIADHALFCGGMDSNVVDSYNSSLTKSVPTALSVARYGSSATAINNYALIGGGITNNTNITVVDVYEEK